MNNIFWKIKRELRRAAINIPNIFLEIARKLYFRKYYDYTKHKKTKRSVGNNPLSDDIAIYLIFPSSGLLDSHLYMLYELRNAGISSIVVSNFSLENESRNKLLRYASLIIERPNIGYDFGGYRDGVLEIIDQLTTLKRLWLLNDSAWLVPQDHSWFDQARALNRDFVSATSSFSVVRKLRRRVRGVEPARYRSIIWNHTPNNPKFHYASYALCIGSKILKDPEFLIYWKKLEIRNDKTWTVRRGELGLTQWVFKHQYSHAATHDIENLDQELNALDGTDLDLTACEIILLADEQMVPIKRHVLGINAHSAEGRAERIGFILTATARRGSAYSLALYNLRRHKLPFLKKSPLWLSADSANMIIDLLCTHRIQESAFIVREAKDLYADRGNHK